MSNFWKYFLFLSWMSYLLVCGVFLFARGFLLRRQVQPEKSRCIGNLYCSYSPEDVKSALTPEGLEEDCYPTPNPLQDILKQEDLCSDGRAKVILIVIDALKYDFASHHKTQNPNPFQNRLTAIQDLVENQPDNARLYRFVADPPTTTMQRLKGLTTGSLPTFIDIGSNFASTEINEDNLIDQLRGKGKKVVFMGDDTWTGLYPQRFVREYPFPSFNVWDLDSVDDGIKKHLLPEMQKRDWNLLVAHFLGVDHCGHRYGPFHSEMTRKLDEMNTVIRDVIKSMDNDTVLAVLGDHGMTNTGDHGGDSEAETNAALFVYSPMGLLPKSWSSKGDTVRQVDLVPTLATILGIPIPFSNLGSVIIDSLPKASPYQHLTSPLEGWKYALLSLWSNARQSMTYIETYATRNNEFSPDRLQELSKVFLSLGKRIKNVAAEEDFLTVAKEVTDFLRSLCALCESVWVRFDTLFMTWGLVFSFVVLVALFLIVEALPGDKLILAASGVYLSLAFISIMSSAVISYLLSLQGNLPNFELAFFISTFGSSFIFLALILAENSDAIFAKWNDGPHSKVWLDIFWRVVCMLSLWAMTSNSYVMNEGQLLSFFLLSLVATLVYSYRLPLDEVLSGKHRPDRSSFGWLKSQVHPMRIRVLLVAFAVGVFLRATHLFWRCRNEEAGCDGQLSIQSSEPKRKSGLSTDPHCLVMLVCTALWVSVTRMWLRSCGNLTGYSATVLFARYVPTVLAVCSGGFWVLQGLPGETRRRMFKPWQLQILPWTVYSLTAVTIFSLIMRPLCIFVVANRKQATSFSVSPSENPIPQLYNQVKQIISGNKRNVNQNGTSDSFGNRPVVYGLATVYSAAYTVLAVTLVLLLSLLLGARWSPALVLSICAAAALLVLISMLRFENTLVSVQLLTTSWPAVLCWSLLAQYAFYGTGHQATFSSIHWDAAMVGTSGNVESSRFFPGLLVIMETFCSHIMMGFLLPLLLIAPLTLRVMLPRWAAVPLGNEELAQGEFTMYQQKDFMYRSLTTLTARYIFLQGVRSLACMFSATIHARHLMVWAIFAPKLIFEAVSLFVTVPCVLLSFLFIGRITFCVDLLVNSLDPGNDKPNKSSAAKR